MSLDVAALPALNAGLNAASAVLLLTGLWLIKHRRPTAHKICMISAFVVISPVR